MSDPDEPQQPLRVQFLALGADGRLVQVTAQATPEGKVERPSLPTVEPPEDMSEGPRPAWRPGRLTRRRG